MPEISKTPSATANASRWFWAVFFILTVFIYFFGLSIPLVGPDEPRYAQVAREMFMRGDWVTPTLGGFNWFEKPALLYWLEIGAYHIFGINEFAARFGSALFGLGTVASLWLAGRFASSQSQKESREFANWLSLIGATSIGIIAFSRGASFDVIVTFPISAALVSFYIYEVNKALSNRTQLLMLALFYFFIGVGLLAKGLIGAIFPFGIVALYFALSRRWPGRTFILSLLWGAVLCVVVASTWYLPMYLRHSNAFVNEFFIQHHFQRFTSNKYQHPQPFYFFFWVLPLMTIPWLPFLILAIWMSVKDLIKRIRDDATTAPNVEHQKARDLFRFGSAWLLFPLIFFSFSGSKLPGYILPAVPAAVLLIGTYLVNVIPKRTFRKKIVKAVALATYLTIVIALIFVVPRFVRSETVKPLIHAANSRGYAGLHVAGFETISHNAEFYASSRLIRDEDGKQHRFNTVRELADYLASSDQQQLLVLVPLEHLKPLTTNETLSTQVLDENGDLAIALVSAK